MEDAKYMFMEVDSGEDKQIYDCTGHLLESYSDLFQKEEETMKGHIALCLILENLLVKRESKEHGERVTMSP